MKFSGLSATSRNASTSCLQGENSKRISLKKCQQKCQQTPFGGG
jgi:hypothetical protein